MDISNKVPENVTNATKNLTVECQVLQNLLNEHKRMLNEIMVGVLKDNCVQPELYSVSFKGDRWTIQLKSEALTLNASNLPRRILKNN